MLPGEVLPAYLPKAQLPWKYHRSIRGLRKRKRRLEDPVQTRLALFEAASAVRTIYRPSSWAMAT